MEPDALDLAVRDLVDEYRLQCLWFLREDYYPAIDAERERVLRLIERHGSLEAFQRAATLRSWLSRRFSDASSAS
ncbi:MAG: hypothetical protein LC791_13490 [Acidobacteria bacterium]|nr:hypothetical protein [Acidobacteriota bacterium]